MVKRSQRMCFRVHAFLQILLEAAGHNSLLLTGPVSQWAMIMCCEQHSCLEDWKLSFVTHFPT